MPITNPYYQEQFQGQPGQSAKAEQVKGEFDGVQSGFDAVYAIAQHALQVPTTDPVLNILPAAASRANKWLRFDASGQPIIVSNPFNFRGAWTASTLYHVGDAYTAAPNNSTYYVNTQYTSGSSFGSTDLSNSSVMVNLGGLYFVNNVVINSPGTLNAVDGGSYLLDSSSGNITVQLPTESQIGNSPINLTHVGGSLGTGQAIVVQSASGQYIMGVSQNQLNMDVANFSCSLMWGGSSYGWRLRTMG